MTLGEKIRKYRTLKGWSQKELGLKVGFSAATADSRIRKYEKDLMAPKDDIRARLADVLGVDLSALSDINIGSYEDVMQTFFLFEEKFGMEIEKKNGKTYLSFDDQNTDIRTLITYMNLWRNQKAALLPNPENVTEEQRMAYEFWKASFAQNTNIYFAGKEKEIQAHYDPLIGKTTASHSYAKDTSEITRLLRRIIEEGFTLSTTYTHASDSPAGPGFTFVVNELLSPGSESAESLFTEFLVELKHFADLGARNYTELQMVDKTLTITYYIPAASFSIIKHQVDKLLDYLGNKENENDFSRDNFEMMFEENLKTYHNNIEEELRLYAR